LESDEDDLLSVASSSVLERFAVSGTENSEANNNPGGLGGGGGGGTKFHRYR
jgi:hypothetical protein